MFGKYLEGSIYGAKTLKNQDMSAKNLSIELCTTYAQFSNNLNGRLYVHRRTIVDTTKKDLLVKQARS